MSRALKLAKRELTKLGCEVIDQTPRRITFRLSRSEWVCSKGTPLAVVRSVIEVERRAASRMTGSYIERFPEAQTWDRLEHSDFYVTKHCKDRIAHMRGQGLTTAEISAAILTPETVRAHDGKLLYCAGRLAVVVGKRANGKYPLITALWATEELWELNPRPEKVANG